MEEYTDEYEELNGLNVKKLIFKTEFEDGVNYIRRLSVGKRNIKPTKTILLVGSTGAGKSSLISSLINVVFGIKHKDAFRIKLKEEEAQNKRQTQSQTEWITVYEFNYVPGMSINYNLTIIDTPGLNDTRGLDFDKLMFERLEMVLKIDRFGIEELHCIGIVTQASALRLTDSQKYVYDGCMRIFGNNVQNIIHVMATFSDQSEPKISDGLAEAGVQYVAIHQFNNSSIYLQNNIEMGRKAKINALMWDEMNEICCAFLKYIESTEGQSRTQTAETLENRRVLHSKIIEVEETFLAKLNEVQNLQKSPSNAENPKTFQLKDIAPITKDCSKKVMNCKVCNITCHKPCFGWNNCVHCKELSKGEKPCRVCGCLQYSHHRENIQFVNVLEDPSRKQKDGDKTTENLRELIKSLLELKQCVDNLKSVALRPIPVSIEEYVKNLIQTENENHTETSQEKIAILNCLKKEENRMQDILTIQSQMDELIRRFELSCKIEKGKKIGCKLM